MSTEPINITTDSVLADFEALVEEYGTEHVYQNSAPVKGGPACVYAVKVDGELKPDCIAGHVLVRHGFPVEDLAYVSYANDAENGPYSTGDIGTILSEMYANGLVTYSPEAVTLLRVAQSKQDIGYTWGEAVEAAKRKLDRE